jgi:hypothetical protein
VVHHRKQKSMLNHIRMQLLQLISSKYVYIYLSKCHHGVYEVTRHLSFCSSINYSVFSFFLYLFPFFVLIRFIFVYYYGSMMTERIPTAHALSVLSDVTWFIDIHCFVASFFFYCCNQKKNPRIASCSLMVFYKLNDHLDKL